MDRNIKLLAQTLFENLLTTSDIYVIHAHLFNQRPLRTLFVVFEDDNTLCLDFDYGNFRASDYLCRPVRILDNAQSRARASEIARELATVDIINDNLDTRARSGVIRRLLRARANTVRMSAIERTFKRVCRSGADSAFIKDAVY